MSNLEYPTMSMNKTCPISNFRSEEDPDGIGFVLSRKSRFNELFPAGNLLHPPAPGYGVTSQRFEARIEDCSSIQAPFIPPMFMISCLHKASESVGRYATNPIADRTLEAPA